MNKKIILTGAMGSGKSTILQLLQSERVKVYSEPAREILAEQRKINGRGLPEKDVALFCELLLSRSLYLYKQAPQGFDAIIFDRGIADNIAYARYFGLDDRHYINAAKEHPYNKKVFVLPAWQEIYKTDDERKMSFDEARNFGEDIERIYRDLDYELIHVPKVSVEERVKFIREIIG